jgi:hypothetical protein
MQGTNKPTNFDSANAPTSAVERPPANGWTSHFATEEISGTHLH